MSGFELYLRSYIIVTIKINQCLAIFYSLSESDQVLMRKAYCFTEESPTTPLRVFQKIIQIIGSTEEQKKAYI